MGVPPDALLPFVVRQPTVPSTASTASSPSMAAHLRHRRGARNRSSTASTDPPAEGQNSGPILFSEVFDAVVWMVSVAVCCVVPSMTSEVGDRLHVGALLKTCGVTTQPSVMVPAK